MLALIFPFLLFGLLAFYAGNTVVTSETINGSPSSASVPGDAAFVAVTHAALAFAEQNQGYSGNITAGQLAPYMGGYQFPSQWSAGENGGQLVVWTDALPANGLAALSGETGGDCAYGENNNGSIASLCTGDDLGPAPHSVPDNAVVYSISSPTN
jgi:hypothetical protein